MQKTALDHHPLPMGHEERVGSALQASLIDLLDLALQIKQAHWNVKGRAFRALHLQLDEIHATVMDASDEVAERMMAIGVSADGRAATIATDTDLPAFPEGQVSCEEVVELIAERLSQVSSRIRSRFGMLDSLDLVSQDLLVTTTAHLEKHLWMVQAQVPLA